MAVIDLFRRPVVADDDCPMTDLFCAGNFLQVIPQGVRSQDANDKWTIDVLKCRGWERDICGKSVQVDRLQFVFSVDILTAGGRAKAGGCA